MAKQRRSPVYLHCERLFPDDPHDHEKLCEWRCDEDRVAGVELEERGAPQFTALLHRSSKPDAAEHPFQMSFFRKGEPLSDSRGKGCAVLLNRVTPHHGWRLRKVHSRR